LADLTTSILARRPQFPLESIAEAHAAVEARKVAGRVILNIRVEGPAA
jgi:hypothetical protein